MKLHSIMLMAALLVAGSPGVRAQASAPPDQSARVAQFLNGFSQVCLHTDQTEEAVNAAINIHHGRKISREESEVANSKRKLIKSVWEIGGPDGFSIILIRGLTVSGMPNQGFDGACMADMKGPADLNVIEPFDHLLEQYASQAGTTLKVWPSFNSGPPDDPGFGKLYFVGSGLVSFNYEKPSDGQPSYTLSYSLSTK